MFTPKKTRDYEALIKQACWNAMQRDGVKQLTGIPIELNCIFRFPVPKSARDRIGCWHMLKPDVTNLLKAVEDGCNDVLYKDDSCLVRVSGTKWWDAVPRVDVTFSWRTEPSSRMDDYTHTDMLDGRGLF